MRKGVEELLQTLDYRDSAIFIAPTGYGKTTASPHILEKLRTSNRAAGLIHVVPIRTLVKKIYEEKFCKTRFSVGYQSQDVFRPEDKSPYFMRELVVTTLDSFVANLYRLPIPEVRAILKEQSKGHYYTPLSNIYTSAVIFDEAHMYTGGIDESISLSMVYASLAFLKKVRVPVVVETATMNSKIISELARLLSQKGSAHVIYVSCDHDNPQIRALKGDRHLELHVVCDEDFKKKNSFSWHMEIVENKNEKIREIMNKHAAEGRVVLIVRNSVEKAIFTYEALKSFVRNIVLLHGKLSHSDRERAIERMEEIMKNGGAVVATQVVEAGVETNASILITDAAPAESLAQRAGRLCREGSKIYNECQKEGAHIYLVEPEIQNNRIDVYPAERVKKTLEKIREIHNQRGEVDWRLLEGVGERKSFAEIMEYVPPPHIPEETRSVQSLYEAYLESDCSYNKLQQLLKALGEENFLRDTVQLRLAFLKNDVPLKRGLLKVSKNKIDYIDVDGSWFLEKEKQILQSRRDGCLQYEEGGALLMKIEREKEDWLELSIASSRELKAKAIKEGKKRLNIELLIKIYEGEEGDYDYLLLSSRCYEEGIGVRFNDS